MPTSPESRSSLWLLLACNAVTTMGLMALLPVMPLYVETLARPAWLSVAQISGIALAAPAVTTLLLAPYAGLWCARFGHRRMLTVSLTVFVLSLLLMGASTSAIGLVLGRLLQGASALNTVLTALINDQTADDRRGRTFGLQQSSTALGALTGPVLGGVMLDLGSIRQLMLAAAVVTALLAFVLRRYVREPQRSAAAAAPSRSWRAFFFQEREIGRWLAAVCLVQAAAFALVNVFAVFLAGKFPGDAFIASETGVLHALGWGATMFASPLWGRLNDRGDPRRIFLIAAAVCIACLAAMPLCASLWFIGALRLIQGACFAALAQSMLVASLRRLPKSSHSHFIGIRASSMVSGQLLGPLVVLLLIAPVPSTLLVLPVAGLFTLAALLVFTIPSPSMTVAPKSPVHTG